MNRRFRSGTNVWAWRVVLAGLLIGGLGGCDTRLERAFTLAKAGDDTTLGGNDSDGRSQDAPNQPNALPPPTQEPAPAPLPVPTAEEAPPIGAVPGPWPLISVNSELTVEGERNTLTFTVRRLYDGVPAFGSRVTYRSQDVTATAPNDYLAAEGILTFLPGEIEKKIEVVMVVDTESEPTESFHLLFSDGFNANVITPVAVGSIVDLPPPKLAVDATIIPRGLSGRRTASVMVHLNRALGYSVSVRVSTRSLPEGTPFSARPGVDYVETSSVVTFPPGTRSVPFSLEVFGEAEPTPDEIVLITLSEGTVDIGNDVETVYLRYGN